MTTSNLHNLKEMLLVITVVYFYGLGFALLFHRPTFGLDAPPMFLTMSSLFLIAILIEMMLAWWNKLRFILWGMLGLLAYAILGLYLAPSLYGDEILLYVFVEPLLITFIGGFAFVYGRLLADAFFSGAPLRPAALERSLRTLPGWVIERNALRKTYRFDGFGSALNFLNRIGRLGEKRTHYPRVHMRGSSVSVELSTSHPNGVSHLDISMAREIDAF